VNANERWIEELGESVDGFGDLEMKKGLMKNMPEDLYKEFQLPYRSP